MLVRCGLVSGKKGANSTNHIERTHRAADDPGDGLMCDSNGGSSGGVDLDRDSGSGGGEAVVWGKEYRAKALLRGARIEDD